MNTLITDKTARRPLIDPLLLILKSRRVVVALCALLIGVLTAVVPELRAVHSELLTLLITLALAVIGGYSVEEAVRAARDRAVQTPPADLRDLIKEVLLEVVNEVPPSPPASSTSEASRLQ